MRARRLKTTESRSALMRRVRQRGTAAERVVRRLLWSIGARYRVNVVGLPGRPDIANRKRQRPYSFTAVFGTIMKTAREQVCLREIVRSGARSSPATASVTRGRKTIFVVPVSTC